MLDNPEVTKSDRWKDLINLVATLATLTTAATGLVLAFKNGEKVDAVHQRIEKVEQKVDQTGQAVDALQ